MKTMGLFLACFIVSQEISLCPCGRLDRPNKNPLFPRGNGREERVSAELAVPAPESDEEIGGDVPHDDVPARQHETVAVTD